MCPRGGCSWQNTRLGPRFASIWISAYCFACLAKTVDARIIQRSNCFSRRGFYNETTVDGVYELFKQSIFYAREKLHPKALISSLRLLQHRKYSAAAGGKWRETRSEYFCFLKWSLERGVINHVCAFSLGWGEQFAWKSGVLSLSRYSKKKDWKLKDAGNERAYLVQKTKQSIFNH